MKVRYDPEAVVDLVRISLRYRGSNHRAAVDIRADIRATIHRVALNPLSYAPIGRGEIRRAVTQAYRYLVYFEISDEDSITVLCVRHGAQRPRFPIDGD